MVKYEKFNPFCNSSSGPGLGSWAKPPSLEHKSKRSKRAVVGCEDRVGPGEWSYISPPLLLRSYSCNECFLQIGILLKVPTTYTFTLEKGGLTDTRVKNSPENISSHY